MSSTHTTMRKEQPILGRNLEQDYFKKYNTLFSPLRDLQQEAIQNNLPRTWIDSIINIEKVVYQLSRETYFLRKLHQSLKITKNNEEFILNLEEFKNYREVFSSIDNLLKSLHESNMEGILATTLLKVKVEIFALVLENYFLTEQTSL